MTERTINQIQIAVQENEANISDRELRLCVESLRNMNHFLSERLKDLVQAVRALPDEVTHRIIKFKADSAWATMENMHLGGKRTPEHFLGPDNIPGSPEQTKRLAWAKRIYKKATGEEL